MIALDRAAYVLLPAALVPLVILPWTFVRADEPDISDVRVSCKNKSLCDFAVTVRHDDSGSEHYADKWEVLSLNGEVLATRVLHHPHVGERTFTRSLANVPVPLSIRQVIVRVHDSVHGYGSTQFRVDISR